MVDALITGAIVSAAVGWLLWRLIPRRRGSSCAACPASPRK